MYKKKKTPTVADFALRMRLINKCTSRAYEDQVIEDILLKIENLKSTSYYTRSKEAKKQLRAEANTIPLTAFMQKEGVKE